MVVANKAVGGPPLSEIYWGGLGGSGGLESTQKHSTVLVITLDCFCTYLPVLCTTQSAPTTFLVSQTIK